MMNGPNGNIAATMPITAIRVGIGIFRMPRMNIAARPTNRKP